MMQPLTHPYRNARKFRKSIRHRPRSSFIGEIGEADEELFAGEKHIAALQFSLRIGNFDQRQIKFFFENRSRIFNLKKQKQLLTNFNWQITSLKGTFETKTTVEESESFRSRPPTVNLLMSEDQGFHSRSGENIFIVH